MAATAPRVSRSPSYPSMSLREAVAKVTTVYRKETTHQVPREVVAKHIGYSSINGASASAISTLIKYGLLAYTKGRDYLKVTQSAVEIVELRPGDSGRAAAIREAAFTPALFTELHDQFQDRLPTDETLRVHLIRRGFNTRSAIEAIRAYRDTMAFVEEEGASLSASPEDADLEEDEAPMETMRTPVSAPVRPPMYPTSSGMSQVTVYDEGDEVLDFRLAKESKAKVVFTGEVTQEAIDKLIALLNLSKDGYPTQATAITAHVENAAALIVATANDEQGETR